MFFGILVKQSEKAKEFSEKLLKWLKHKKIKTKVLTQSNIKLALNRIDAVIVIGGDGTLLYTARLLDGAKIPIIGINMGGLGFLTEISPHEAFDAIECFIDGRTTISERMMCDVNLYREEKIVKSSTVLNDAVITKGNIARMIELETFVDKKFLSKYRSDGLIVSTPTGSTAYVLSAGGPIIAYDLDCIILCPICPHTLTHRPIVLSSSVEIEITNNSDTDVYLTFDGQEALPVFLNDRITIKKSDKRTYIVNSPFKGYFEILNNKLNWGER